MKLQRLLHDLYAQLSFTVYGPVLETVLPPAHHLLSSCIVQEPGRIALSNQLEAGFHGLDSESVGYAWPETRAYKLRSVFTVGDQGSVFFTDGSLFAAGPTRGKQYPRKVRRPLAVMARRVKDPVFHLTGRNFENRGHFTLNHLPRLAAAGGAGAVADRRILTAPGHSHWQRELLGLFGCPSELVTEGGHGTYLVDDLLYIPQLAGGLAPPKYYQDIRAAALNRISDLGCSAGAPRPSSNPIYVSRADAPNRRILNEAALVASLNQQFFGGRLRIVTLRGMALADQVRTFAKASLIIGPMGQGMTNVLFARGVPVVILDSGHEPSPGGWSACFRDLALLSENPCLRLLSGTEEDGGKNYEFPEVRLNLMMSRLLREFLSH